MTMTKVCVQQQTGGSDCGGFAIDWPVAAALAHDQDPAIQTFNQGAMREHLRLCLQAKRMDPFPTQKKLNFKNRMVGREVESLYCTAGGSGLLERLTCTSAVHAPSGTMNA